MLAVNLHEAQVLGQAVCLLEERALFLPAEQSLLVSDVHLGKAETFQMAGIPIPTQVNQATIARLKRLCEQLSPQRLFILGDLFHARQALVESVLTPWRQFLAEVGAEVTLVVGNHDRRLVQELAAFEMACTSAVTLGGCLLSHEPVQQSAGLNICGHIHPVIRLSSRLDALRLPCFWVETTARRLTLPAFGDFTGGYEVAIAAGTQALIAVEGRLLELSR
ncbi:ligase-associated DNA damage response endonuclease PdeM [Romeria aff. gracilis LEGE 07310]|uniref:Ligase-associated DNA damage response endonuclease PdeM n=1 Tax=Vasconcelosia minhoensis LEGE 07310 TaxID=915328 RepID=A0A8J7AYN9_9CYAN|nr:ligase-associated DNA damage response endonuclease PdeM [Romeria gracilis]MBE9078732.1 ligase-associated DNA damage response endonuclease PdeM [Romeria aff. gracilis LEGE 07310]